MASAKQPPKNPNAMAKKKCPMKYKKAPGAPRRFKSAFMFFSENEHKVIRERVGNNKIRAADAAKMVSQSWKELSNTQRSKWLEMARIDRERYEKEKAAYRGPWRVPNIKHPNPPKKPMSAFLAFGNERRRAIAEANPSLTNAEISSLLSKLWKQCPADVKQAYRDREAREREAFKKYRSEWERKKDLSLVEAAMAEESSSLAVSKRRSPESSVCIDEQTNELDSNSVSQESYTLLEVKPSCMTSPYVPVDFDRQRTCSSQHFVSVETLPDVTSPAGLSDLAQQTISPPQRSENNMSRFNGADYSLEQLLQDEELFEDFSPDEIPALGSSIDVVCNGRNYLPL